tara:strand:- start:426 stop:1154 length:729 start_codon:yes stop_codon:yes gene_type:complete
MNINKYIITVSGIPVEVIRKDIKNLHLSVCPPEGHVRLSMPQHITNDNARLAVVSRLKWIKTKQNEFRKQPRQTAREFVSGESHYFKGKRYILKVIEKRGKHSVTLGNNGIITLQVNPETTTQNKERLLSNWYREEIKNSIDSLLKKWQGIIGKEVRFYGIRKMKTKWGSCNIDKGRIWINLELAKKSPECLEYILVHELIHLLERNHNDRFKGFMEHFLPSWRVARDKLNSEPLSHEDWNY